MGMSAHDKERIKVFNIKLQYSQRPHLPPFVLSILSVVEYSIEITSFGSKTRRTDLLALARIIHLISSAGTIFPNIELSPDMRSGYLGHHVK